MLIFQSTHFFQKINFEFFFSKIVQVAKDVSPFDFAGSAIVVSSLPIFGCYCLGVSLSINIFNFCVIHSLKELVSYCIIMSQFIVGFQLKAVFLDKFLDKDTHKLNIKQ